MPSPRASIHCVNATPHPRSSRGVPVGPRCSTGPSFIARHDPVPTIDLGDITVDEEMMKKTSPLTSTASRSTTPSSTVPLKRSKTHVMTPTSPKSRSRPSS
ncbi:hypothetical protein AYX15_05295 [Cryptococcus neoformans]|nr:hypothetical protein AYX15_05295 [Cryptococcus neoformans var. grubii]